MASAAAMGAGEAVGGEDKLVLSMKQIQSIVFLEPIESFYVASDQALR